MTAGYQGTSASAEASAGPTPNQWFGGPAFGNAGALILRDAVGLVVDSLNFGLLVDPWAAEGYHGVSGTGAGGCRVTNPGGGGGRGGGPAGQVSANDRSAGRFPDGRDTDSNCNDFLLQTTTTLPVDAASGATNIKVASTADFAVGQTILIDAGSASVESAAIATIGTAGGTTVGSATAAGATVIPIASNAGFVAGQTITIDSGGNAETAVVVSTAGGGRGGGGGAPTAATVTVTTPLRFAHAVGAQVSGTGITLTTALTKAHVAGARVATAIPTPGAPNRYYRRN